MLHFQALANFTLRSAVPQEAKELLKKAEYNRETKNAEAKVVSGAARTKRTELNDLERLLARWALHMCELSSPWAGRHRLALCSRLAVCHCGVQSMPSSVCSLLCFTLGICRFDRAHWTADR